MGDPGGERVFAAKPDEKLVQGQEQVGVLGQGAGLVEQLETDSFAAAFQTAPGAGVLDEDPPHGLGRRGEEVPSAIELLVAHQAQIGFVDQGRGIERVAGPFVRHMTGRELAQLVIDQRQQL